MADLSQAWRARHLTPGDSIGHTDTGGVDSHTEHVITLPPEHPLCALRDLWLSTPSSGASLRLDLLCGRGKILFSRKKSCPVRTLPSSAR